MIDGESLAKASAESVHFLTADEAKAFLGHPHHDLLVYQSDRPVNDRATLFAGLAKAMKFPDYFGDNWDAVDECLRDAELHGKKGLVFLLHHAAGLWKSDPHSAGQLVEVWLGAVEEWRGSRIGFHLVFVW